MTLQANMLDHDTSASNASTFLAAHGFSHSKESGALRAPNSERLDFLIAGDAV